MIGLKIVCTDSMQQIYIVFSWFIIWYCYFKIFFLFILFCRYRIFSNFGTTCAEDKKR